MEYSKAKDDMLRFTDTKQSPWYVVDGDDKRKARLNCIHHLLSQIDYENLTPPQIELPEKQENNGYIRPPIDEQTHIQEVY